MAPPATPKRRIRADLIKGQFLTAWGRSDAIFDIVGAKAMLAKPIVWRHPFIFYVGHLPAFAWNQICSSLFEWPSYNACFDDLFCRGIDPDVDTGECHWHPEVPDEWPSLSETLAYRDRIRSAILDACDALAVNDSYGVMPVRRRLCNLVLEHEYMHQETLLYMMAQLDPREKRRAKNLPKYELHSHARRRSIRIAGGPARLGTRIEAIPFGWDNEFGEIIVEVPSFSIDSLPVTNGQFYRFIECGAYNDERHWQPADWRWKELENKLHPACWRHQSDQWFYRAMFDDIPLDRVAEWPVYVSLAEARAYASWQGKRLPTEAEFHRAAYCGPDDGESTYPWGNLELSVQHGNFDFACWSPTPVGAHPAGASRWGVHELVGNGWELTDTPFAPLPGFEPMDSYPDYSRDFFDGKHFVLKGASWATDATLLRPSFRNWYQGHYPYVFAKFRCVTD